jgi:hypothetical protein
MKEEVSGSGRAGSSARRPEQAQRAIAKTAASHNDLDLDITPSNTGPRLHIIPTAARLHAQEETG